MIAASIIGVGCSEDFLDPVRDTTELTTAEIAEELKISIHTVEGHRKNLLQKTNSKNVVGLIKYTLVKNLI